MITRRALIRDRDSAITTRCAAPRDVGMGWWGRVLRSGRWVLRDLARACRRAPRTTSAHDRRTLKAGQSCGEQGPRAALASSGGPYFGHVISRAFGPPASPFDRRAVCRHDPRARAALAASLNAPARTRMAGLSRADSTRCSSSHRTNLHGGVRAPRRASTCCRQTLCLDAPSIVPRHTCRAGCACLRDLQLSLRGTFRPLWLDRIHRHPRRAA